MTAVEYIEYMWTLQGAIYKGDIDKALEMEKEQKMQSYEEGYMRVAKLIEDATQRNLKL
jgi:hypothetical protein